MNCIAQTDFISMLIESGHTINLKEYCNLKFRFNNFSEVAVSLYIIFLCVCLGFVCCMKRLFNKKTVDLLD